MSFLGLDWVCERAVAPSVDANMVIVMSKTLFRSIIVYTGTEYIIENQRYSVLHGASYNDMYCIIM